MWYMFRGQVTLERWGGVRYRFMKIPFDDLLGITAGVTGNLAILIYAAKRVSTDRPDIGYAIIFPGATVLKIMIVEIIVAFWAV
jgi:putative transport protein